MWPLIWAYESCLSIRPHLYAIGNTFSNESPLANQHYIPVDWKFDKVYLT